MRVSGSGGGGGQPRRGWDTIPAGNAHVCPTAPRHMGAPRPSSSLGPNPPLYLVVWSSDVMQCASRRGYRAPGAWWIGSTGSRGLLSSGPKKSLNFFFFRRERCLFRSHLYRDLLGAHTVYRLPLDHRMASLYPSNLQFCLNSACQCTGLVALQPPTISLKRATSPGDPIAT